MQDADIVLLAFKLYMIDQALSVPGAREALTGKLLISVIIGTPFMKLIEAIQSHNRIQLTGEDPIYIKMAMLNIAAEFRKSMTVIESTSMPREYEDITKWIFLQLGKIAPVALDLSDLDGVLAAVAGVSGALLSVAFDGILMKP